MGREKKKVVEVKSENIYNWVHVDVKHRASAYCDNESLHELKALKLVKDDSAIGLEILPCGNNERVCERRGDWAYFYMYTPYFTELHLKFPFSDFECKVLTQLNCALSQLHPNS
ncbi:hypothetical protein AHAS_Ahas16G0205400 [Arachis hypogaea]